MLYNHAVAFLSYVSTIDVLSVVLVGMYLIACTLDEAFVGVMVMLLNFATCNDQNQMKNTPSDVVGRVIIEKLSGAE